MVDRIGIVLQRLGMGGREGQAKATAFEGMLEAESQGESEDLGSGAGAVVPMRDC